MSPLSSSLAPPFTCPRQVTSSGNTDLLSPIPTNTMGVPQQRGVPAPLNVPQIQPWPLVTPHRTALCGVYDLQPVVSLVIPGSWGWPGLSPHFTDEDTEEQSAATHLGEQLTSWGRKRRLNACPKSGPYSLPLQTCSKQRKWAEGRVAGRTLQPRGTARVQGTA